MSATGKNGHKDKLVAHAGFTTKVDHQATTDRHLGDHAHKDRLPIINWGEPQRAPQFRVDFDFNPFTARGRTYRSQKRPSRWPKTYIYVQPQFRFYASVKARKKSQTSQPRLANVLGSRVPNKRAGIPNVPNVLGSRTNVLGSRVRFPAGAFAIFSVSAKASLPISLSPFPFLFVSLPLPLPSTCRLRFKISLFAFIP